MLQIKLERNQEAYHVHLAGVVEEGTKFGSIDEVVHGGDLYVYCRDVTRISSAGLREWIRFFSELKNRGERLTFHECSPVVVDQLNLFPNFLSGGKIESLYVPFACKDCGHSDSFLFSLTELKSQRFKLNDQKCSKCSGVSEFDDIREKYFGFFME